ncbi:acyltransferase family protein [Lederbergia citrea]|uniref:acyltransferase family protein n=1 Tax=Lederbergia citrea TaxID=2833581 RepID=UPI001BC989FE|nr:acyltransferase [Lederbergia citrea]MBS4179135.1 acyltransferase [Lederbergia citrea]
MHRRFSQLDSLRGLAAISVFFSHMSLVTLIPFLKITVSSVLFLPLNILAGQSSHSFVNFFFVLSGFVLYLLFTKGRANTYTPFIIKRFFRLYIPYIVAVTVSIAACVLFSKGGIKELSGWFNLSWVVPLSIKQILQHVLMIGNFNTDLYNNVIWSLVQEMRVSLIFPILAFIILKVNWRISLILCVFLSFFSGFNNIFHWQANLGYHTSFFASLQIASMFIVGGLLAKHLSRMIRFYEELTKNKKIILFIFTIGCFLYNEVLTVVANYLGIYQYGEIMSDYAIGIGSVLIILISLASRKAQTLLLNKPFLYLGKISYSLYLYHLPVLFSLIYIFHQVIPLWSIFVISIPIAIVSAHISWRFIEKPASMYGNIVAGKVEEYKKKKRILTIKSKIKNLVTERINPNYRG